MYEPRREPNVPQLYALFKAVTVSRRPESKRPSIFDMTGRAKWDAWDALGRDEAGTDVEALRDRYVRKARELGWTGAATAAPASASHEDGPIDWESDDVPPSSGPGTNNVSTMSHDGPPPDVNSLHGCVHAGDVDRLKSLLDHAGADVNSVDEFVRVAHSLARLQLTPPRASPHCTWLPIEAVNKWSSSCSRTAQILPSRYAQSCNPCILPTLVRIQMVKRRSRLPKYPITAPSSRSWTDPQVRETSNCRFCITTRLSYIKSRFRIPCGRDVGYKTYASNHLLKLRECVPAVFRLARLAHERHQRVFSVGLVSSGECTT